MRGLLYELGDDDRCLAVEDTSGDLFVARNFPLSSDINLTVEKKIEKIRGKDAGTRHRAAYLNSEQNGVTVTFAVSQEKGTFMAFSGGDVLCHYPSTRNKQPMRLVTHLHG
jgi:hypothetical protein